MSLPVGFRVEAEREYMDARAYYEGVRPGKGAEFDRELHLVLKRLSERPEICQIAFADVRRAVLRQFPYVIYFRVHPNLVDVLAVFHGKRDPHVLIDRL